MAVPAAIRSVPRPKNTVVIDNHSVGPLRFSVRSRKGVKYNPNGNPKPINGPVIGHIIDGRFVPLVKESLVASVPKALSYGSSSLVRSVSKDLLSDLLKVYTPQDAYTIMAIAALRVIKPRIAANRYGTEYRRTFISVYYPGLALSKNSVCTFIQHLGMNDAKRREFYLLRLNAVCRSHHIAIDGTLKQDSSSVNDLSAFSYKGRVKNLRDISIVYAYDIEKQEPLCAEVFPGNSIDAASYRAFIDDNGITSGIIIADKGFPVSAVKDEFVRHPDLHYISPLKRNDVRIKKYAMTDFTDVLFGIEGEILYKKQSVGNGSFLYSFKDNRRAAKESQDFLIRARVKHKFDKSDYDKHKDSFGVIVFESDENLSPDTVYRCYAQRWQLELMFDQYKHDEMLTVTSVQNDFSVIGSEFIDFIATVTTSRIIAKAQQAGLLNDMTYGNLMDDLGQIWRKVDAPEEAEHDDIYWVHPFKEALESLEKLGLCKPQPQEEHKRPGRPKKEHPEFVGPKRPRGRPRKPAVK